MNHIIMNHNCRYHKAFIFYSRSIRGFQSYKLKANVFVHHRLLFYDLNKKEAETLAAFSYPLAKYVGAYLSTKSWL